MSELIRSNLGVIYWERGSSIVVLQRSPLPVLDEGELLVFLDRFDLLIPPISRKTLGLLMDMREGPLRNDPAYEQRLQRAVVRLVAGFRRVALLMQTSVGVLQAGRLRRENGQLAVPPVPFRSEAEARAYLSEP